MQGWGTLVPWPRAHLGSTSGAVHTCPPVALCYFCLHALDGIANLTTGPVGSPWAPAGVSAVLLRIICDFLTSEALCVRHSTMELPCLALCRLGWSPRCAHPQWLKSSLGPCFWPRAEHTARNGLCCCQNPPPVRWADIRKAGSVGSEGEI